MYSYMSRILKKPHTSPMSKPKFTSCMLAQDETACAHASRNQQGEAEPPRRVEEKDDGKGKQSSDHGTCCSRMGADANPVVNQCAYYLQDECTCQNADHDVRHVHT